VTRARGERADVRAFVNADKAGAAAGSLRVEAGRILAVNEPPEPGDCVVDLHGDRLLPGLINAHDHLQLNSFPAFEPGRRYRNVREWLTEVQDRLQADRAFEESAAVARDERLLIGGIKNLLSGVTTVAHHDPLYEALTRPGFPTRVLSRYGWSHSLYLDGEESVSRSYRRGPADCPWIIHAAEGLDDESAHELDRLDALGCLRPNTLIVHGVALDRERRVRLRRAQAGLIWCPASNLRLFGATADVADLVAHGAVALGTDSRLSGSRDLLDELRVAARTSGLSVPALEALVTRDNARILRLGNRGALRRGALADLLVLPRGMSLLEAGRAGVRLVMIGGIARYADKEYAEMTAPMSDWAAIRVDGREKFLNRELAEALSACAAGEEGVLVNARQGRAA
jgi:cytosine/adenosine deaminase-related metal-dependent hydrolase